MSSSTPPPQPTTAPPPANGAAPSIPKKAAAAPLRPIPAFLQPLRFMGVPTSVLRWQPKLPSRNWLIFLSTTGTLASLYAYDRKECKRIREEYKERVKHLAEEKLEPREWPRKVTVFCVKSPGDEDYDKSVLYFKKFVKPILVAAAIDWELTNGTRHGGLARELRERIFARRRQIAGLEPWGTPPSCCGASPSDKPDPALVAQAATPFALTPQEQLQRELDGATVVVGRPAFKEYMWALHQGWTLKLPPRRVDLDEPLARALAEDSAFDEVKDEGGDAGSEDDAFKFDVEEDADASHATVVDGEEPDGAGAPLPSRFKVASRTPQLGGGNAFLQAARASQPQPSSPVADEPEVDARLLEPPTQIPAQPPLAFVPYTNLVGIKHMPRRMVRFFMQRNLVREGGEAALRIALGTKDTARDIDVAPSGSVRSDPPQGGDLDFDAQAEAFYPSRWHKLPGEIEKARAAYYKALPRNLKDTRSLVRGEREPSTYEKNDPPKTEQQLREERMRKEREWRGTLMGHELLRSTAGVAWSEAFRGALRVLDGAAPAAAEL